MAKAMISGNLMAFFMAAVLLIVAAVNGQEMAPSPAPAAGAGFSLTASTAVVGVSLLFSFFSLVFMH